MNRSGKFRAIVERPLSRRATFLGVAVLFVAMFGVFHLLGWRDDTAIISGTYASPGGNPTMAAVRGVLYGLAYFAAVIASPILILATGIHAVLRRWAGTRGAVQAGASASAS
jgi:hypothetical protein